jgi:hypothetical protein
MKRILIKKAFWAFHTKEGYWFKSDCMEKVIGATENGRLICQTPHGKQIVSISHAKN